MRGRLFGLLLIGFAAVALAACGGSTKNASTAAAGETGEVPFDRAFIDGMVPHHRAAIEMANGAKSAGLSQPDLVAIAGDIVATQQLEIDEMLDWRKDWFGSRVVDPQGAQSLGLSEDEMGMQHEADFSSVDDVDQAFAAMMIDHHRGEPLPPQWPTSEASA